jgi:bifunctional NMN adenylyltransferase/nudix hydrolase
VSAPTSAPLTDAAAVIGRWTILHNGHFDLVREALANARTVVVALGSALRARDARNPFTWQERRAQFEAALTPEDFARVRFLPVRDYYNDERWVEAVRSGVEQLVGRDARITLVGHKKDYTSQYLDLFLGWHLHEITPRWDISATDLRNAYFQSADLTTGLKVISDYVPRGVCAFLDSWRHLPAYRYCAAEHKAVLEYRQEYTAPFYLTGDSVVTAADCVLLVQRGGKIGNGLLALPGGFLELLEQFYAGAVRELGEEATLRLLPERMRQALRGQQVFDHPLRSNRGRLITTAFHFHLSDDHCPAVRAGSDANEALWVPLAELPALESRLFEDHACILDRFLGLFSKAGSAFDVARRNGELGAQAA